MAIEQIEKTIIEKAFEKGWVKPQPPSRRTGKTVAVIGSGPSGLACAQQLNTAGHAVTVFERDASPGGLLRYGIPDFKLEKTILDRTPGHPAPGGNRLQTGVQVGVGIDAHALYRDFDALVLCTGSTRPRDLSVPGRELAGIHFAMDFLKGQNRVIAGETGQLAVSAAGKQVIVIGGGDTGSDCIGTSHRQEAASVVNFELLPQPSGERPPDQPWPYWPMRLRTSSSHEEGGTRHWNLLTKRFVGEKGRVMALETVTVAWKEEDGRPVRFEEIPGTAKIWPADLVLLALGFVGPESDPLVAQLDLKLNERDTFFYRQSQHDIQTGCVCRRRRPARPESDCLGHLRGTGNRPPGGSVSHGQQQFAGKTLLRSAARLRASPFFLTDIQITIVYQKQLEITQLYFCLPSLSRYFHFKK